MGYSSFLPESHCELDAFVQSQGNIAKWRKKEGDKVSYKLLKMEVMKSVLSMLDMV